jgi:hypothetical protein
LVVADCYGVAGISEDFAPKKTHQGGFGPEAPKGTILRSKNKRFLEFETTKNYPT